MLIGGARWLEQMLTPTMGVYSDHDYSFLGLGLPEASEATVWCVSSVGQGQQPYPQNKAQLQAVAETGRTGTLSWLGCLVKSFVTESFRRGQLYVCFVSGKGTNLT